MISCPQCGASLKEGAKFCHVCGFHIPETTEQTPKPETNASETPGPEEFEVHTYTDVNPNEVLNSVKSGGLFKRAFRIMFNPKQEWEVIAKETPKIPMILLGYVLVLSIIPVIALVINSLIEIGLFYIRYDHFYRPVLMIIEGIGMGVMYMIICIAATIISAVIIKALAPAFKSEKNLGRTMQLVAYSITPVFFGGLLFIFPVIGFLGYLAGFYGIYIAWNGLVPIMKTPKERQVGYFFTTIGIIYGVFWALWLPFMFIYKMIFGLIFGGMPFYY